MSKIRSLVIGQSLSSIRHKRYNEVQMTGAKTDGCTDRWEPHHNIRSSGQFTKKTLGTSGDCLFVCVEVLRPSQPNGVMSSAVSLPNHMFTGQA